MAATSSVQASGWPSPYREKTPATSTAKSAATISAATSAAADSADRSHFIQQLLVPGFRHVGGAVDLIGVGAELREVGPGNGEPLRGEPLRYLLLVRQALLVVPLRRIYRGLG